MSAEFAIDPAKVREWKRYPEYKDSGVEWLGEVPAGWGILRLKQATQKMTSGATPASGNPAYYSNSEDAIPWVTIADISKCKLITATASYITEEGVKSRNMTIFPRGTLLYSIYASLGKVAVLGIPATTNQAILGFVPIEDTFTSEYLFYWLRYMEQYVPLLSSSNTQDNLNAEKVRNMPILAPSLSEQHAIVTFLDRETARIDALIEKRQRFIELLEEKRQALIAQAVTKGLDPDVEMKDSGVEWLGEVPAGWDVLPLSVRYHVQLGKMLDKKQISGDYLAPYLRNANIQWGKVDLSELYEMDFTPSERDYYSLKPGDLLVCEGGEIGRTAVWNGELDECYYQKAVHRVRPRSQRDNSRYFYYVMVAAARIGAFDAGADASTIRHLTAIKLRKMRFAFPPGDEQSRIVGYLDSLHSGYESLRASTRASIEKLHEYRTALISAAVTGKIDVRGEEAA